jgi:hypothetical protein
MKSVTNYSTKVAAERCLIDVLLITQSELRQLQMLETKVAFTCYLFLTYGVNFKAWHGGHTALPPEIVSSSEEQRDVRDRQNDDLPLEAVDNEIQPMDIFVSTYIILFDR